MVVIGAKGHAKEVLEILPDSLKEKIVFFDNITQPTINKFLGFYNVINSINELKEYFKNNNTDFCLAIGGTTIKEKIASQIEKAGGKLCSVIDSKANIGTHETIIGSGCNVMKNTMISNSVTIGKGVLVNYGASIHHDATVGNYCEISPGAMLLGRSKIGNYVSVGAGSIILPDIEVGDNVIIGAGAVVTKT